MSEIIRQIMSIAAYAAAILSAVAGFIVSLAKSIKNKKLARIAEAVNEISELVAEKVAETEELFSSSAQTLKAEDKNTGEIKKERVMSFIESKCAEKGVKFDSEKWSNLIENLLKVMNGNKK